MRKVFALIAALALLLALFACGKPAEAPAPFDLAAFAEDPLAFDLTDLAQFLTPPQLAGLETALRAELSAQGLEDYAALHFADPPPGCVKIPFANDTGADLSRLDTAQLARHIAGQVTIAFEARGVTVGATVGRTTTTAKAATTTTTTKATITNTTTTSKTTTTKAQAADYTPPQTLTIGGNLDRSRIVTMSAQNHYFGDYEETPTKVFRIDNNEGSWIIDQRPYADNYKQGGLILDVYLSRGNNGTYDFIQTLRNSGATGVDDMFKTYLLLDSKAEKKLYDEHRGEYYPAIDILFEMRNPDKNRDPVTPELRYKHIDVRFYLQGPLMSSSVLITWPWVCIWQFNGSKFDKVDPNML